MSLNRRNWVSIFIAGLVCLPACDRDDSSDNRQEETTSASFSSIYSNVLNTYCQDCHGTTGNAAIEGSMNFDSQETAYSEVQNTLGSFTNWTSSISRQSGCDDYKIVESGNADRSLLLGSIDQSTYDKLLALGCTTSLSIHQTNNATLDEATIEVIKTWINNGAAND